MKKLLLLSALTLLPFLSVAQEIFDKYQNSDKVTFISMQPKMFQMLARMSVDTNDPEAQDFFELVNSITSFKIITTQDEQITNEVSAWVVNQKRQSYQELMRVKESGATINFYIQEGKDEDHVKELLMFVTGIDELNLDMKGVKIETVLLSLSGDINLKSISKLTDLMQLPGGDQLRKASQK